MHEEIVNVAFVWLVVRFCGETDQAIFEEENPEWIHSIEKHIDPQIELQVVYKERVCNVLLCNHMIVWADVIGVSYQENSLALT